MNADQNQAANRKPSHEEIALCAYLIWKERGCTDGHDLQDWMEAETQLGVMSAMPPGLDLPET